MSRSVVVAVLAVAATVVSLAPAQAVSAHPKPMWSPGPVPRLPKTSVKAVRGTRRQAIEMPRYAPTTPRWPAASTRTVSVGGGHAAGAAVDGVLHLRVLQGAPATADRTAQPVSVLMRTLSHATAQAAGVDGVLVAVSPRTGAARRAQVSVGISYASIADAFGGGFGSRLRLVQLPLCVLTTPAKASCRRQTPVTGAVNDAGSQQVEGTVSIPAAAPSSASGSTSTNSRAVVLAATSSSASSTGGGDYSATSMAPSQSWSVGNTGAFTYRYPITVPPALGGAAPSVALAYDSAAADGRTSSTNNQASWIGDGWDYSPGFIERSYKTCKDDGVSDDYDQCWAGDNATLSLNGQSDQLVPDGTANQWRSANDDGTIVTELSGASNGLHAGTYWQVITNDGTQYFFGADHLPSTVGGTGSDTSTQSAWGEPVYGNDSGEPCNSASFATSSCTQGWRWNLDFVIDPNNNLTTYHYKPETNDYSAGPNQTLTSYVRGGVLTSIDYGQQVSDYVAGDNPAAQVLFTSVERCDSTGGFNCAQAVSSISSSDASHYPDVPYDLYCASSGTCSNDSPSYWSELALSSITTRIWDASRSPAAWTTVDTYKLSAPDFPANGGASQTTGAQAAPALWLDSITRTGNDTDGGGSAVTVPKVTFAGVSLPNRVDYSSAPDDVVQIYRFRMSQITTETGENIDVTYNTSDPCKSSLPTEDADTKSCFPVRWTPNAENPPILDWFNTYPVTQVAVSDNTTAWGTDDSPTQVTSYAYAGAAWHRDDSPFTPDDQRTWGEFRGYKQVTTETGQSPDPVTETVTNYLQGMSGDYHADGTHPAVTVTDLEGNTDDDDNLLAGYAYQTRTYSAAAGTVQAETVNVPWLSAATATSSQGSGLPDLVAKMTGTAQADTVDLLAKQPSQTTQTWRTSRITTSYDSTTGLPTQIDDLGQIDSSGNPDGATTPEKCTTIGYAAGATGTNMVDYPDETITDQGACSAGVTSTTVAATKTYYDSEALGTVGSTGNVTGASRLQTESTGTWTPATKTSYDTYGRVTKSIDPLNRATNTTYAPSTWLPTTVTTTNPKGWTSTATMDPARQLPISSTDVNGNTTTESYDGLGRLTAVWLPDHSQSSNPDRPNDQYSYNLSNTKPISVTSSTLGVNDTYLTSIAFYDAMMQQRQVQATPEDGSTAERVISDTDYDSHGWANYTDQIVNDDSAPSTIPVVVAQSSPQTQTETSYDGRGRPVSEAVYAAGSKKWATTIAYPGADETDTTAPTGGTDTSSFTDARGQQYELTQDSSGSTAYDDTYYYYDALGRRTKIVGPIGPTADPSTSKLVWTTSYDGLGNPISKTDPDTGKTTSTYDADSELLTSTDAAGATLSYSYDVLGRELTEGKVSGTTTTPVAAWSYDPTGGLGLPGGDTAYASNGTTATYESTIAGYDTMGAPTAETVTIPAGAYSNTAAISQTQTYTYTPLGHLLSTDKIQDAGTGSLLTSETVGYSYNGAGLLDASSGTADYLTGATYDEYGDLSRAALGDKPDELVETNAYDAGTRRLEQTATDIENDTTGAIDTTSYTYNEYGATTSTSDVRNTSGGTATTDLQCYTYDGLDRLTDVWTDTDGVTATSGVDGLVGSCKRTTFASTDIGGPAPYAQTFAYDLTGDRTSDTDYTKTGSATPTSTTTSYTYGSTTSQNALTGTTSGTTAVAYDYTPDGQTSAASTTTSGKADTAAAQALTWNPTGTLANLTAGTAKTPTSTYGYDTSGNLIARTDASTTTLFLGNDQLTLSGGAVTSIARTYTGTGLPTVVRIATSSSSVLHYQVANAQGTGLIDVTSNLATITRRGYTPYGQDRTNDDTGTNWAGDNGFVNGTKDTTTTLTNLGAREYNPNLGRFIDVDPLLETNDPQALNGYSYATDNPISLNDPTGLTAGCGESCNNVDVGTCGTDASCDNQSGADSATCGSENACAYGNTEPATTATSLGLSGSQCAPDCNTPLPSGQWAVVSGPIGKKYSPSPAPQYRCSSGISGLLCNVLGIGNAINCGRHVGLSLDCGLTAVSLVPLLGKAADAVDGVDGVVDAAKGADAADTADGAANAANGVRLAQQLARESADSAFTSSGELQPSVIADSHQIISGSELGNPGVVSELTSDGSKIEDWGKYTTQTIRGPSGNFQVHYYMNNVTGAVNYNYDYKIVFTGGG